VRSHAKAASAASIHRENHVFSLGVIAAMLACAAAFLGIGAPAACAAPEAHPAFSYLTSFQGSNEYVGPLGRPVNELGVDSHGNIVLLDGQTSAIEIFAPDATLGGTLLTTFSIADQSIADDIAVDPTTDAIYVQDVAIYNVIKRYVSDGQPTPTYTLDPSFSVEPGWGIAVDPTTHDLLVADPNLEGVRRYDTGGALVETIPTPSIASQRLAVASDGSFYVAQEGNPKVLHFSGAGTLLNEVQVDGEVSALTVNPTNDVLVVAWEQLIREERSGEKIFGHRLNAYSSAGEFLSNSFAPRQLLSTAVDGSSGRLYGYRAGFGPADGGRINVFIPATQAGIAGLDVSAGPHSADLSVEIDPGAGPPAGSEMHFEISADGGKNWSSTSTQSVGAAGVFEAHLTDLLANFDYLVRVVAKNDLVSNTTDPLAFRTAQIAPEVESGKASDLTETSAVLNGTINPDGLQTTYHFEYGTTTAYGSRVPAAVEGVAGAGRVDRIFSRTITGLLPATTYHFRIVAENAIGVTAGADQTFTTTFVGEMPIRGYEQVTPVDKKGNPLDLSVGFQVSDDGSAIAYNNRGGDESSPSHAFAMSRRGVEDWESGIDLTTPLNSTSKLVGVIINTTTLGISPDLTRTFVATNRKLTPQATEGGTNLYRQDIATGSYDLIGTFPTEIVGNNPSAGLPGFIAVKQENKYIAGAKDFSWIVFISEAPLLPDAPSGALYRWSEDDGLEVISVLPDGEQAGIVPNNPESTPVRQVSDDGSRIYFAVTFGYSEGGVFLYEEGKPTKAVSVSRVPGDPDTPQQGRIMGASADGRYLFFYSNLARLTSDAPNESGKADIYRYDAADDSLEYLGAGAQVNAFEGLINPVNSSVPSLGVSEDGSTLYFQTANNVTRVWRDGVISDVGNPGVISPNGRYLLYLDGGEGFEQPLYLYDADQGTTDCVSCLSSGFLGGGRLPAGEHFVSNYVPRVITNAGQAFFTSASRLVAADVNGNLDVYMYQGGRRTLISPADGNYQAVLSDVSADGHDVYFTTNQKLVGRDNDETPDIYDARIGGGLASQSPPARQECLRDDCKATPNAGPELPFGGSEALSGPENVKPQKKCRKGRRAKQVKGKVRCVKKHHKQHRKHIANKAGKGGNR
jgi:hypothetical protein